MLNQGIAIAAGRSRYRRQLTGVRLSMGHISFWVAAIVAPFLSIVVNGVLRICLGKPQSAAADFILTIIVFDVVVISQSEDFKKFIMPAMRGDIGSIFACLILINLCMWFVAIFKIEEKMDKFYDRKSRTYRPGITGPILGTVVMSVAVVTLNFLPFAYGE